MKKLVIGRLWIRLLIATAFVVLFVIPTLARFTLHLQASGEIYGANTVPHHRAAIVLGTRVYPNGELAPRLASRVDKAIELYKAGKVDKLLMSGDGRPAGYEEPQHMRDYAIKQGVKPEDIATDLQGLRTYASMYRARHVYGIESMVVVTQGFHLDRSLFYCREVGIDAVGVPAELPSNLRDKVREPLSCVRAMIDAYVYAPKVPVGDKKEI